MADVDLKNINSSQKKVETVQVEKTPEQIQAEKEAKKIQKKY